MSSHQEREYNELQGARPCCYRGPQELNIKHVPASACCIARDLVQSAKFYCKFFNKNIISPNICWCCRDRKEVEVVPTQPTGDPQ